MTIKKRIFISNTVMVFGSLLILLSIAWAIVSVFKEEFLSENSQNVQLAENNYEVQGLLMNASNFDRDWTSISVALQNYGFELYVTDDNGNELYSNIKHSERECLKELLADENFNTDKIALYYMENVTIAKEKINISGNIRYIYAINYPDKYAFLGINRGMFEMFIIIFLMICLFAIAGLILCSQFFTKMLIKKILKPVEELKMAARRIEDGNLDELIIYNNSDEFQEVCTTFNNMQKHLKEGLEKNAAYEKARTDMISGISHDLRTPLTSVKGYIKGIKDGVANTSKKQDQYLNIAYKKACEMDILLQKLFYFSKLDTGNMPFYKQETELSKWISSYVKEKSEELSQKNIILKFEPDRFEHKVSIDVEQIKRVFDNIIENSVKYVGIDNIILELHLFKEDTKVCICISDNGHGIEDEKLPHLFEQFYRGDESRNSKIDGNGLGLYICKYIIAEHGGTIEAKNQNGFSIYIRLPEK